MGLGGSGHAQSSLPAGLDDGAFWNLIVELSEPDGFFTDENYVSNELGLQRLLPDLGRRFEPGGVYLGVGPEQNFSYVAALRPRIAFIVDIRRQNAMEHLVYKVLFELAGNRADFVSLLFSRPRPPGLDADSTAETLLMDYRVAPADRELFEATLASILGVLVERHGFALSDADRASVAKVFTAFYEAGPEIQYIYEGTDEWHPNYVQLMDLKDASGTNWSYLGSEERFLRVRRMQLANLIVPVVGDFAGPKTLRAIGDYVRARSDTIDVFYVSNVEPYLFRGDLWRPFYDNVATLPVSDDAIFIRTFFGSTARECRDLRPSIRTPLQGSIVELVEDYRSGEIETQCALVERSR
ncbi:MAG TPA: hypothetical protein VKA43_00490 [Gammaproteobacteria bacterium]|nr:hypothetical protein [Gammaproteobacteria bacterium]